MKGIILAGGYGTRMYPLTKIISKHLLPIYDKPLIYYPMSSLLIAGIKDILIISTKQDILNYKKLFGDGSQLGISIQYEIQNKAGGIPEAFIIGKKFIGDDSVALILGDNIFYSQILSKLLYEAANRKSGATIFGVYNKSPKDFGVLGFNAMGKVISIEEKPENPRSNYVVPGLYFYDNDVINIVKKLKPSSRGELEITDLNKIYLNQGKLNVKILGRGTAWFDAGTHDWMLEASQFISTIQRSQGLYIACLEEIVFNAGYIDSKQLQKLAIGLKGTDYGKYLKMIADGKIEIEVLV